jgi:hypothetical protein
VVGVDLDDLTLRPCCFSSDNREENHTTVVLCMAIPAAVIETSYVHVRAKPW